MNCKLTLGEKLKDLRTAAGLSLVELEEATGISKSALGSYESDDTKKEITIAPLITLANDYLNAAKEKREPLNDSQFIEYLYNRAYSILYLLRLKS